MVSVSRLGHVAIRVEDVDRPLAYKALASAWSGRPMTGATWTPEKGGMVWLCWGLATRLQGPISRSISRTVPRLIRFMTA